ncbi:hypothetical protein EXE06_12405 [Acinetobacter pittii]|uniref:hypothetical protein n=1 Tax=Acinetobacter pittii TaxID=48296 RepID=UPI000E103F54|nr:hypothetical protein [Acinetobacter pittii]AXJ90020.1 hypothetical protein DKP84_06215 [Acinetobacter pittii]MCU4429295.1 hypothetical protein [Acinetobacter pittii]RZG81977.1 hypothetical protein EXE06_12405 [Acinetobacter pittii]RZH53575.1 hypothetical protein EXD88_12805 [Acinetobacter pittii]RZH56329.1 hypothetical protein EXD90_15345 [Acinetobacter pittii]
MSPPDILPEDNYEKPLHSLPLEFDQNKPVESRFFFNHAYGALFKFNELKGNPKCEYSGCIEVFYCHVNEMALSGICAVAEDYEDPYEAATKALEAGFGIDCEEMIGRYTFKDFIFHESDEKTLGKQIKGAFANAEFQQFKIATLIYKYLTKKYGFLVSDNNQTRQGHTLWVLSVLKWAKVKSYDCVEQRFISAYETNRPCPDFKPWSVPYSFPMDKEHLLRMDLCVRTDTPLNNVVLIASFPDDSSLN